MGSEKSVYKEMGVSRASLVSNKRRKISVVPRGTISWSRRRSYKKKRRSVWLTCPICEGKKLVHTNEGYRIPCPSCGGVGRRRAWADNGAVKKVLAKRTA